MRRRLRPSAVDSRDDRQPYTDSYSVTISQRLPWASLLELAYVGNQSHDLQNTAGAGSNINLVPVGAMFGRPIRPRRMQTNSVRCRAIGDINLATNNLYANYNALQMTWARQRGRYTIQLELYLPEGDGHRQPIGAVKPTSIRSI